MAYFSLILAIINRLLSEILFGIFLWLIGMSYILMAIAWAAGKLTVSKTIEPF